MLEFPIDLIHAGMQVDFVQQPNLNAPASRSRDMLVINL